MMFWNRSFLSLLLFGAVVATDAVEAQSSRRLQSNSNGNNGNNNKSCDLDCPRNAPCRFGNADFSERMDGLMIGTETHRNGMHCDCPIGWTGILCDRKYETCTNENGHECYNGGECIFGLQDKYGNEQLFCDCTNALGYVGKHCETPFEQKCSGGGGDSVNDAEDDVFCVNGGECNPNFPDSSPQPCFCDEGWEGYYCEYKKNKVPECTLDCENDGVCFLQANGETERGPKNHRWSLEEFEKHMVCACPPGFGGFFCEAPAEQCGNSNDHVCLNGGKCLTTTVQTPDGMVRSQYRCDCTMATNEKNDPFAGKYCEHKATSMCSSSDWGFFCTQGGTCKSNPTEGCSCRTGTTGYQCELILDSADQEDMAQNDSNSNSDGSEDGVENNDDNYDNYDFDQDDNSSNTNKKTNSCADGYCLNGGNCVTEQIIMQNGSSHIKEYCDCSEAYDENSNYAGPFCQYKSTSLCFVKDSPRGSFDETFCVHHGVCQNDGSCDCPSGWTGQYCEEKTLELDQNSVNDFAADAGTNGDGINFDFDQCGETICYNGGVCVQTERLQSNGDFTLNNHCDCSSAFDENYAYAGASCEFPSTEICAISQTSQGLEGSIFCTNHGTCMDSILLGCNCPPGFYGFACEYESRGSGNNFNDEEEEDEDIGWNFCGNGVCHHGGQCITSILYSEETDTMKTNYNCDCSTAHDDDTAYLGPSCEYPSTSICAPPKIGEPLSSAPFCVNHGTCGEDPFEGCTCSDGFTGRFCQFKTDLDQEIDSTDVDSDGNDQDFEPCGDDLVCLNGGQCARMIVTADNGETFEIATCDCDTTWDGFDIFAGVSCEYKSTSICATPTQYSFCVNGGKCQENDVCDCDLPWKGINCELPADPEDLSNDYGDGANDFADDGYSLFECDLKCMNGSVCVRGEQDLGFIHDSIKNVAHLKQPHAEDQVAHCACTDGWIGPTCETELEICGDYEHFCAHGSECTSNENVDSGWSCDCSKANDIIGDNNEVPIFVGDSCQYTGGLDICSIGNEDPGQPFYFCVNGGSCNGLVIGDEPDPGCTCPENFAGPDCEVYVAIGEKRTSASESNNVGVIAGAGTVLVVLIGVLALVVRYVRSKLTGKNVAITSSDDGVPDTGTPFSPRRRRKAGFGGSARHKKSPSSSHDADADPIEPGHVDENDGVMNNRLEDEARPYGANLDLVEDISLDDAVGSKLQGSHFV